MQQADGPKQRRHRHPSVRLLLLLRWRRRHSFDSTAMRCGPSIQRVFTEPLHIFGDLAASKSTSSSYRLAHRELHATRQIKKEEGGLSEKRGRHGRGREAKKRRRRRSNKQTVCLRRGRHGRGSGVRPEAAFFRRSRRPRTDSFRICRWNLELFRRPRQHLLLPTIRSVRPSPSSFHPPLSDRFLAAPHSPSLFLFPSELPQEDISNITLSTRSLMSDRPSDRQKSF